MITFYLNRFVFIRYSCSLIIMCLLLSSESSLLPYKRAYPMLVHMVEMFLASFTGEINEHIAFKQIMFGSFNSTTNTQRTVYDIF